MCWRKHKKKKKKSEIEKYREFEKWNIYLEETHLISLIIFLMSFLIILISLPLQNLYAVATLSIIFLLSFLIAILALIIKLTLLGVFKQYDIHKIILLNLKDLEKNLENKDMSIKNDKTIMHILFNLKKYRKPQMLNRMSYKMRFQNYFFEKAFYSSHDVDFFENRFVIRKKALQSISQFIKRTILLIDNEEKKRNLNFIIDNFEKRNWLTIFNKIDTLNEEKKKEKIFDSRLKQFFSKTSYLIKTNYITILFFIAVVIIIYSLATGNTISIEIPGLKITPK